jgi:dTDP-4-amino-4,6-dideoxygalactose transaminase
MAENGIGTQIHYPVPPHLAEAYSSLGFTRGSFPITENESETILSLPMYNGLTNRKLEYITKILNNWQAK